MTTTVLLLLIAIAAAWSAPAPGASSSTVVSAQIPSAITLVNTCGQRPAWELGTVVPGSSALTNGGANVCRISFQSSNDTSMLRVVQSDRTGTAMTGAGTGYTQLGSGQPEGSLPDVDASSGSEAFATMGYTGTLTYRTSIDGGATWTSPNDATAPLSGYRYVTNPQAGVVFRAAPTVVRRSVDGGTSWVTINTAGVPAMSDIEANDANNIWIMDLGTMYKSTNGGTNWSSASTGCANATKFTSESTSIAYVPGPSWGGGICVTTNGSASWQQRTGAQGVPTTQRYYDADAPTGTPSTAWAVGSNGTILKTTNSGASWVAQSSGTYLWLHGVYARSTTDVWAVGDEGVVLHTTDGGTTWSRVATPTTLRLINIAAPAAGQVFIGGFSGTLLTTTNDGSTWTASFTDGEQGWLGIDTTSRDSIIVAGGAGRIRTSTNAGGAWSTAATPATTNMRDVAWAGTSTAIAVGDAGTIWQSTDTGATFTARSSPTSEWLHSVDAFNDDFAVAVGSGGAIVTSSDGGRSWTSRASGTAESLAAVSVLDAQRAVAVGAGGVVTRTTNGGATWTAVTAVAGFNLRWVTMPSSTTIYASATYSTDGTPGFVWKSTDGGATFTRLAATVSGPVSAPNEDILFVGDETIGWGTPIRRSQDGGATFTSYAPANAPDTHDISAVDGSVAFAAIDNGAVRRTDPATSIGDYGGANTWANPSSFFGGCLQSLGGSAIAASWTADPGGSCTAADTDPWNAVPTAPVKVANTIVAGGAGSADFVWGMKAGTGQAPGRLGAGITFEALAPNL